MPSVIGVFKEGIGLVKDNYFKVLAMYLVLLAIVFIIGVIAVGGFVLSSFGSLAGSGAGHSITGAIAVLVVLVFIAILIISPIWSGTYYSLALQAMGRKKASLRYALRQSGRMYKQLLWTSVIQAAITIIIMVLIFLPFAAYALSLMSSFAGIFPSSNALSAISSVFRTLGLKSIALLLFFIITLIFEVIASFILSALFYEAVPLVMIKGTSGLAAVKASVKTGKRYFWSIIGLIILVSLFGVVIYLILEIALLVLSALSVIAGAFAYIVLLVILESFLVGLAGFLPIVFYKRYVK